MRRAVVWLVGAVCSTSALAHAAPGQGTVDDPVIVDAFPYATLGTTVAAPSSAIDAYDCAPGLDESGPERIYRFELDAPARVTAWIEGDGGGVDVDVHLLDELLVDGASASGCVARGNAIAEAELDAGEHAVVVDSFAGQVGDYVLHLEAIGDGWIERPIAEGVVWRARRFGDLHGPQVVHELVVDTSLPEVIVRAAAATGCQTVAAIGAAIGAVAGINGGYFGGGCAPVSLLIASGSNLASNGTTRGAFGLSEAMTPMIEIVAAGQGWPGAYEAHGGGPVLVAGGTASQGDGAWAAEGFVDAGFNGNNPRTLAGYDAGGRSHFATVDGRRPNAAGMSLDELASYAAGELALGDAVNLDGGGSTTMWIAGATPNGVVNYPSDAGATETMAHSGARGVSGGLFVIAPPYDHLPRFQTEPVTGAAAGEAYAYDADAIDLNVDDVVTFSLTEAPDGMTVDAASGVVSFTPTAASPPSAPVVLVATGGRGASAEQSWQLTIAGGMGDPGSGGAGVGGGGDAGGHAASGSSLDPCDDGGCSFGRARAPAWVLLAAGLLFGVLRRRRGALLAIVWLVGCSAEPGPSTSTPEREAPAKSAREVVAEPASSTPLPPPERGREGEGAAASSASAAQDDASAKLASLAKSCAARPIADELTTAEKGTTPGERACGMLATELPAALAALETQCTSGAAPSCAMAAAARKHQRTVVVNDLLIAPLCRKKDATCHEHRLSVLAFPFPSSAPASAADEAAAVERLAKACTGGHGDSCLLLAVAKHGDEPVAAGELARDGCRAGSAAACPLAIYLADTNSRVVDPELYRRAGEVLGARCEAGGGSACHNLGVLLERGQVAGGGEAAGKRYRQACDTGLALACAHLLLLGEKQKALAQKLAFGDAPGQLARHCEPGAAEPLLCFAHALALRRGWGIKASPAKAAPLFKRLCRDGYADACTVR